MSRKLEASLARLLRRRMSRDVPSPLRGGVTGGIGPREAAGSLSPAAFRAVIDERLGSLERQLDELKGRVNGLLFLLAGAVATQVILKLFG